MMRLSSASIRLLLIVSGFMSLGIAFSCQVTTDAVFFCCVSFVLFLFTFVDW